MFINREKIKKSIYKQGITLDFLLKKSGVSRTAFFSLARKENILPKSICALAETLGVSPGALLSQEEPPRKKIARIYKKLENILATTPQANREDVLHTLLLLEEKPIQRLERSLRRGQKFPLHGE